MKAFILTFCFAVVTPFVVIADASSAASKGTESSSARGGGLPKEYQAIIDRKPFGEEPENFDPTIPPQQAKEMRRQESAQMRSQDEQRVAAAVRVSVLNVTPRGDTFVGFTDSSAQPPVNYFMKVGETNMGWVVVSADPASQVVVLSKDGVDVSLPLGEGTAGGAQDAKGGRRMRNRSAGLGQTPMLLNNIAQGEASQNGGRGSYRDRLRARQLKQLAASEAEKAELKKQRAKEEEEKKRVAEERAAMRDQLQAIQESLAAAREESAAKKNEEEQKEQQEQVQEEVAE